MEPKEILKDNWLKFVDFEIVGYSHRRGYHVEKLSRIHNFIVEETVIEEKRHYIISGNAQCVIKNGDDRVEMECSFELICYVVFKTDESGVPIQIQSFTVKDNKIFLKDSVF